MQMFHRSHWMHQALLTPASANITAGSPVPADVFVMMCLANLCLCMCNACTMCMCPEVLAHVVASRKQERCRRTFNTRSNQTLHYYKLCTWYKNIACWKLERYHLTIFCVILLVGGLGKKCRTFGSCTIAHCLVLTSFDKQLNNKYLVFLHSLQF